MRLLATLLFLLPNLILAQTFNWHSAGPINLGSWTRAIQVDSQNPDHVFAGHVTGGLHESWDGGQNWGKVLSFNESKGIGTIAQADLNPNIWLIGSHTDYDAQSENQGVFISYDNGQTWQIIGGSLSAIAYVNDIEPISSTNDFLLSTDAGIMHVDNNVLTLWPNSPSTYCKEVELSGDAQLVLSNCGGNFLVSNDAGNSWQDLDVGANSIPSTAHIEFAISKSKVNGEYYVYAHSGGPSISSIYASVNSGAPNSWYEVVPPTTGNPMVSNPLARPISVHPDNPSKVIFNGGANGDEVNLYSFELTGSQTPLFGQTTQLSLWSATSSIYLPKPLGFAWSDTNFLLGTKRGIYQTTKNIGLFAPWNDSYQTTIILDADMSADGDIALAQRYNDLAINDHNNQQWNSYLLNSYFDFPQAVDISQINDSMIFVSAYLPHMSRSLDGGVTFSTITSSAMQSNLGSYYQYENHYFHENFNNVNSTDSLIYVAQTLINSGDTICSINTAGKQICISSPVNLSPGDSIKIQDTYQSLLIYPNENDLWLTREAARTNNTSFFWWNLNVGIPFADAMEVSKDGDILWISSGSTFSDNILYRISGLNSLYANNFDSGYSTNNPSLIPSSIQVDLIATFNASISNIASDPNDNDHIVVTLQAYGGNNVQQSYDATSAFPTFNSIQGTIPHTPNYDACIDMFDSQMISVANHDGLYTSFDGGTTWLNSSPSDAGYIRASKIDQSIHSWSEGNRFPGRYLLSTFGKGVWINDDYLSSPEITLNEQSGYVELNLYPNPTYQSLMIDLLEPNTNIEIYDAMGNLIAVHSSNRNRLNLDVRHFSQGTYFVRVNYANYTAYGKFIKIAQ